MSFKKAFAVQTGPKALSESFPARNPHSLRLRCRAKWVEFYTGSFDRLRSGNTKLIPEFLALMKRESERNDVNIVMGITGFYLELTKHHR